ncbi:peptidase M50 [Micromonospora sp. WMMD1082]|uniref:peptidase M50 n=1 Tax=Micromonospora sp. WMMD1082 TaxID=3016104 RepID=UPI002416511A|nr:peptidase M50 [Micromonospora sp. WMMD1082]MDG4798455.1 peptidase M50 [Micromonospora sp. WMMD1082]
MTGAGLLAKRPRLREDLVFSRPMWRGPATVCLVKDRRNGREFEISAKERFLVRRLDGVRSLSEINAEYAAEFGRRLGDAHWTRLLWLLHERDLLDREAAPVTAAEPVATAGPVAAAGVRRRGATERWARRLSWLLHPVGFALLCVPVVVTLVAVGARIGPLWQAARPAFTDPASLLALVLLAWIGAALHEFAHALTAVAQGATVNRVNLVTLTCRVDDYLYLPRRSQQVAIAAAGGVANGLVLVVVGATLAVIPGAFADRLFGAYVLLGSAQTLVNVIPLPPLDGYKIVSHLMGALNLAPESRRYLYAALRRPLRRTGPRYPRRAAIGLALYGAWWLLAVTAVAAAVSYLGGALLRPALGTPGYVLPAAVVALTIAGWLARSRRGRPMDRTLSPPAEQDTK